MKCLQATKAISDAKERRLSFTEKIGLTSHLIVCARCRHFAQNCDKISQLMQQFMQEQKTE